jgi:hypothetical protein
VQAGSCGGGARALVAPRAGRGREAQHSWVSGSRSASRGPWLSGSLPRGSDVPTSCAPALSSRPKRRRCRASCSADSPVCPQAAWVGLGAALPACHRKGERPGQARPQTHLLRLEPPMLRAVILHLAPPAQPHHQSARDVLDRPEVKGKQQHTNDKLVHKAGGEPLAEQVG